MVYKGVVASVSGNKARIIADSSGLSVPDIVIPQNLDKVISKGMSVIYCKFPDGEGVILSRTDGEVNVADR